MIKTETLKKTFTNEIRNLLVQNLSGYWKQPKSLIKL